MASKNCFNNTKDQISLSINALIEMIKNPKMSINNNAYFYHPSEKNNFLIYIYIFLNY